MIYLLTSIKPSQAKAIVAMGVLAKPALNANKKKRPMATDNKDIDNIRKKKKKKAKKNKKPSRTKPDDTTSLIDSIFGSNETRTGSIGEVENSCTIGKKSSLSLTDSIFDNGNNVSATTKPSSAMMTLFDNPKIMNTRKRPRLPSQQQTNEFKMKEKEPKQISNTKDKIESILRNRRCRSDRPLLKNALDFPGVFHNEEENENSGLFLLNDETERAKETADAIREHGFCVIRDVIGEENNTLNPLRDVVLPAAKDLQRKLHVALKARDIHYSTATFRFREAASRCYGRTDVVFQEFERDSMAMEVKEKILRNPKVFPVIQDLLGGTSSGNCVGDIDGNVKLVYAGLIFSYPGSCDQPWHQDGENLFPELPGNRSALLQASLPTYALNVFLPLEDKDGSIEMGPTEFLPGSHKWIDPDERLRLMVGKTDGKLDKEGSHSNNAIGTTDDEAITSPILKQGDALIYDYRVCHRGTANLFGLADSKKGEKGKKTVDSNNEFSGTRRILYLMFARPWFTDHINFDYTKSSASLWGDKK